MERSKVSIDAALYEPQLRTIERLAHHAVSLLRRARATLETIQSLARERLLPWAVDGAVRELDPDEVEAVKSACEDVIEEAREALREVESGSGDEPEITVTVEDVEPHLDEGKPAPCAS
jgi:hypothetical protein